MDDCLARAAEVCPNGYDIVTTNQESVPLINPYQWSMYIRCQQPHELAVIFHKAFRFCRGAGRLAETDRANIWSAESLTPKRRGD